ncbi:PHLOEM PROTEIN 2-LIKE A10-like [Olea europaea subsp. europaea]|uniref:PHLOEM PROTEIN 2-LIKE A10-like n=1 Tax=Olea europaea subsp. europaea TaxID=158383 RepID=A0A8S0SL79_OLEEU|nr:PHLOEM PROTEIN 2-LIKE A10-like [Olea europaea subsp. europaea]
MDLELLKKGIDFTKRKKKWILVLGALGFTSYKIYNSPSVVKKRKRLLKLLGALVSVAEMVSDSAETIGIISNDFKEFIRSDSNQIPNSLKQISKITRSDEFSNSVNSVTKALTVGILRGFKSEATKNDASVGESSDFSERVMNKLFSDSGSGFASIVVGSFARNLVMAFYSDRQHRTGSNLDGFVNLDHLSMESDYQSISRWIEVANEDKCRELIGDCIKLFVSTAVSVYLEKSMHINTYDEIFSGLTNPMHESEVKDLLVTVCNGAVETLIQTSHQVWTKSSIADSNLNPPYWKVDFGDSFPGDDKVENGTKIISARKLFNDPNQDDEWRSKISSTLAVPSNRKYVLDMTGKVTFETVRSFLEILLEKLSECTKRSVDVVHQEVVDRGIDTMRYVGGRSSAVATVCLTLCLHILNGPWILAPY